MARAALTYPWAVVDTKLNTSSFMMSVEFFNASDGSRIFSLVDKHFCTHKSCIKTSPPAPVKCKSQCKSNNMSGSIFNNPFSSLSMTSSEDQQ
eukprot:5600581-Amphidinium_carterae.1